jgi:hypothetical protein
MAPSHSGFVPLVIDQDNLYLDQGDHDDEEREREKVDFELANVISIRNNWTSFLTKSRTY